MRSTNRSVKWCVATLVLIYSVAILAEFFSPYDPAEQDREHSYAPPTPIHFFDYAGGFHLRPFVCAWVFDARAGQYRENAVQEFPIRFLMEGTPYRLSGLVPMRFRLFGVDRPGRVRLSGTDAFGRDVFSRFLGGARISLLAGAFATGLSLGLGITVGSIAGFYSGWVDAVLMRLAELFMALPWLYLLFAVRAFLPMAIAPQQAFFLVVAVIGIVGWARPARLVRGVVLSGKERYHVLAARGFGASNLYLLWRHVLPQTWGVVLTQAALLVPQYILAEVTLSFFGLGVSEPVPSLGNLLASAQQYHVMASYWWMLSPGLALIPVFWLYAVLASALQERLQPTSL